MRSDWKQIIHREGKHGDGLTYKCEHGHEWFHTFRELDTIEENMCPVCSKQRAEEASSGTV